MSRWRPGPTSIVPSANVIVVDNDGAILLIRRTDNGNIALPGGGMDLGKSITQAAVREVREETGLDVELTGLVGIYTNPRQVIEYTSNGEVRQEFSIVFSARPIGGVPTTSDESSEVLWAAAGDIEGMRMHPSMRQRIEHFLDGRPQPYLG